MNKFSMYYLYSNIPHRLKTTALSKAGWRKDSKMHLSEKSHMQLRMSFLC